MLCSAYRLRAKLYETLFTILTAAARACCRTAEGRKCRLGEGGFGVVYKAVMNGVDEVAVKLVKVRTAADSWNPFSAG
jgi:hypothetical protein